MKKVFIFFLLIVGLSSPLVLMAADDKEIILSLEVFPARPDFILDQDFYSQFLENNVNFGYNIINSEPILIKEFFHQGVGVNLIAYRNLTGEIVISVY